MTCRGHIVRQALSARPPRSFFVGSGHNEKVRTGAIYGQYAVVYGANEELWNFVK